MKGKTPRSRKYLSWIRTQPCCVTGAQVGVQAAHVRLGNGGGIALKPSDYRTLPLSAEQHARQHRIGERTFWEEVGKNPDGQIIVHLIRFIADPKKIIAALERCLTEDGREIEEELPESTPAELSYQVEEELKQDE